MAEVLDEEGLVEGNFDQIRIYDAPVVALTQIMDGEASWRSFRDTFLDPGSLSPSERDTITGRLKQALGDTAIGNTLVDVATNPFVLLMFATSPAAGAAIKGTGRVFTGLGKEVGGRGAEYMQYVVGNYSPLRITHLLNAHQLGAGTPLTSILHETTSRLDDLTRYDTLQMRPAVVDALKKISVKFGADIDSLDPSKAPAVFANVNGEMMSAKDYLSRLNTYGYAAMSGMGKKTQRSVATIGDRNVLELRKGDKSSLVELSTGQAKRVKDLLTRRAAEIDDPGAYQSITNRIKQYLKRSKVDYDETADVLGVQSSETSKGFITLDDKGALKVNVKTRNVDPLDPEGRAAAWMEREGFSNLLTSGRTIMRARYADMFLKGGKEGLAATGKIEYDEGKLLRIFDSLSQASRLNNYEASSFLVRELFGGVDTNLRGKILKGFATGDINFNAFKKMLVETRKSDDLDNFMSRNVWSFVKEDGSKIRVDASNLSRKGKQAALSGRVNERRIEDPLIDPEDLEQLAELYGGSVPPQLEARIAQNRRILNARFKAGAEDGRVQVMNLDFNNSVNKYLHSTRNDLALFIDEVGPSSNQAIQDFGTFETKGAKAALQRVVNKKYSGGPSRFNLLELVARQINNSDYGGGKHAYDYITNTLVERIQGNVPMKDYVSELASMQAKRSASWIANSRLMKEVEKTSDTAKRFVGGLRQFSEDPLSESSSSRFGRGLTTLFYSSHLGFNLGSATLNLFQPLMFATSSMGPKAMVKGYAEGLKQYFDYIKNRIPLGLNADPLEVDELRKKTFRLSNIRLADGSTADLLDIRKNAFELLDSEAFAGVAASRKPGMQFWATELPLKLFTNTEIFNRVVTGEAMAAASKAAGQLDDVVLDGAEYLFKTKTPEAAIRASDNIRQMVQNTQFGSDIVNSPAIFQSSGWGLPWVRQFLSFPVRTLSAWTDTSSMINQGRRTWGAMGFETQGRYTAMAHDFIRMMGTSAIIYEAGKNALGVDLSRGLSGQTLYESTIVGPALLEGKERVGYHLPLPPAGDVLMDAVSAVTEEDQSILGTFLPRFIPGGIGLSRMLNMAPRLSEPSGWMGGLQRESADWSAMQPDGQVPIYRTDGSLLEYRSAPRTILGSLGFNSYMFKNDQELNRFLVKNRQAVIGERRKYLDAVLANDMGKAGKIKAAFEKRFKFPLSVSKDQVDRALQLREVPLKERMYQRMSPAQRPIIRPYLSERLETLKSRTPEELDLSTAQKARVLPSTFDSFDPYSAVTE